MVGSTEDEMRQRIGSVRGADASGWEFLTSTDQLRPCATTSGASRVAPLLPPDLEVGAFVFDVHTGELDAVDLSVT